MPYRRRTYRRPRRRPPVGRRLRRTRRLAGQRGLTSVERIASYAGSVGRVARTVSMLAGLVNAENKFLDTTIGLTMNNTGTIVQHLTAVSQGDDFSNRDGRSILSNTLDVRCTASLSPTATEPSSCGMAIVMDKKADIATACNWDNVYSQNNPWAFVDKSVSSGRFVILARTQFSLTPDRPEYNWKRHINLKGIHIKFDGTNATDLDQNQIFLICITDAAATQPVINGLARYNFYDN